MSVSRCTWVDTDPLMIHYHDTQWGVPLYDDGKLFEFLVLDTFQAGLSWKIILNKRTNFRWAFEGFNAIKIAMYKEGDTDRLLNDSGIIRNRQKIQATIDNAKQFLKVQSEEGSFSNYVWRFVQDRPIVNSWGRDKDIPSISLEAQNMSNDLKSRHFMFVGPTICYAFMQAAGLVNDHLVSCFRYMEVAAK